MTTSQAYWRMCAFPEESNIFKVIYLKKSRNELSEKCIIGEIKNTLRSGLLLTYVLLEK